MSSPPRAERSTAPQSLQFINLISHELRGPAALLRGHFSMWLEGNPVPLPPEVLPALQVCYGSVLRLNNLINQMILAVRIQEGGLVARTRPVDLSQWLRSLTHDISIVVTSTQHGFQLELPPGPVQLDADQFLLGVALFNLVDNAQKFSPKGTVVRVALRQGADSLRVDVIDQGSGFPKEFELEPFVRIDHELGFDRPGIGVGLFIARGIAAAHGGQLDWSSTGSGTIVSLLLPKSNKEPK